MYLTHNACLAYPEWIKDKTTKLSEDDIDNVAAEIIPTELEDTDNEIEQ
jgi:hypothetical protein